MSTEKVYIGKGRRFIIQQEVGFSKLISKLKEEFSVRELKDENGDEEIILVEEKEKTN